MIMLCILLTISFIRRGTFRSSAKPLYSGVIVNAYRWAHGHGPSYPVAQLYGNIIYSLRALPGFQVSKSGLPLENMLLGSIMDDDDHGQLDCFCFPQLVHDPKISVVITGKLEELKANTVILTVQLPPLSSVHRPTEAFTWCS